MEINNSEKTKIKCVKFADIKHELEPLSVVLFRGSDFVSKVITKVQDLNQTSDYHDPNLRFSHTGVLVNNLLFPNVSNLKSNQFYVYEQTYSGKLAGDETPDEETGKFKFGLQIRNLESVLKTYPGSVFILKLKKNPFQRLNGETEQEFNIRLLNMVNQSQKFHDTHKNIWYQFNLIRLLASVIPHLRWLRTFFPFSKYWTMCSQIATEYLKAVGVVSKKVISENVVPEDFIFDQDKDLDSLYLFRHPPIQIIL